VNGILFLDVHICYSFYEVRLRVNVLELEKASDCSKSKRSSQLSKWLNPDLKEMDRSSDLDIGAGGGLTRLELLISILLS
jgi:hypothetical protein